MHGLNGKVWRRCGSDYDEDRVIIADSQWLNVTWLFRHDLGESVIARFNSTEDDGAGTYNMSNRVNVPSSINAQELIDCAPDNLISNVIGCHVRSSIIARYDILSSIKKITSISRDTLLRSLITYNLSSHDLLIGFAIMTSDRRMIMPMPICKLDECIKDGALDEHFLFERALICFDKFKEAEVAKWLDTAQK
jgi:hypothetical protein